MINQNELPADACEGDFVYIDVDGKYRLDKEQAAERRDKLARRVRGLFSAKKQ